MVIKIEENYQGLGCIDVSLAHDNNVPNCKQRLKTVLRFTGDTSTYLKALSGINEEDGGTYIEIQIQGVESVGTLKVLYKSIGTLIKAVENNE